MVENAAMSMDGSRASAPDLDWSQVRETVRLLNLAVAHIEESMSVGNESVDVLTDSFTTMAGTIQSIAKSVKELPESGTNKVTRSIEEKCESLHDEVHAAIIAFQFYDRLVQKLTHVSNSMDALGELIIDDKKLYDPLEWSALQEKIRCRYTMESERRMFDALMKGASIQQALEQAKIHKDGDKSELGDIDLF